MGLAIIIGVFGLFGLCAFAIIKVALVYDRKRTEGLQAVASKLDFDFVPDGDDELLPQFRDFKLFRMGRKRRMSKLLRGRTENISIAIFDYKYTTGGGKNKRRYTQTVASICSPELQICEFSLRPEGMLDRVGAMLGFQNIDFESHQTFSKQYVLQGKPEDAVRSMFQPAVLEYFESKPGLTIEAAPGKLILYQNARVVKPEEIENTLNQVFEIFRILADNRVTATAGAV